MPRTFVTTVYKFEELSQEAQEHAIEKYRDDTIYRGDYAWLDEIRQSFKALMNEICGVSLRDYELNWDYPSYSKCRVEFDEDKAADLTGQRAVAWFESNLFGGLRENRRFCNRIYTDHQGKKYSFHRFYQIPDCPLTGYCADDELLDYIRKSLKSKMSVKDILVGLADEAARLGEQEIEYQNSDECIRENIICNEYEFTEDGEMI